MEPPIISPKLEPANFLIMNPPRDMRAYSLLQNFSGQTCRRTLE